MPKLTLIFKDSSLGDFPLEAGKSLKIGRRSDNDVVINNLAVSGYHAKIDSVNDGFVLIDLRSKNGSFVNEKLISSHWLKNGDVINIGKHCLLFSHLGDEEQTNAEKAEYDKTMVMDTTAYRSMMEKSSIRLPQPEESTPKTKKRGVLSYVDGGEGDVILKNKLCKIGRDPACDIVIRKWLIGRTAAIISRHRDGYYIEFLKGLTKLRVNGEKISKTPLRLKSHDIISLGSCKFHFFIKRVEI